MAGKGQGLDSNHRGVQPENLLQGTGNFKAQCRRANCWRWVCCTCGQGMVSALSHTLLIMPLWVCARQEQAVILGSVRGFHRPFHTTSLLGFTKIMLCNVEDRAARPLEGRLPLLNTSQDLGTGSFHPIPLTHCMGTRIIFVCSTWAHRWL